MHRRPSSSFVSVLSALALSLFGQGCDNGGGITDVLGSSTVTLSVAGLEPISGGMNYQAWLIHDSGTNTFGFPLVIFNIDDQGRMVDPVADTVLTGPYHADVDVGDARGVTISLEVSNQLKEVSSFTFIISGELSGGTADLNVEDFFALGRDFSNVSGQFALFTPTDEEQGNDLNGIWFVDPTQSPVSEGLDLPPTPNGWFYEGWVEVDGKPISSGKFPYGNLPDSASSFSGPVEGPEFPGEDFLFNPPQGFTFPLDLSGASVFITLEPWYEWDLYPEDPFFLRILEAQIPADPATLTPIQMTSVRSQFPSGTATIQQGS